MPALSPDAIWLLEALPVPVVAVDSEGCLYAANQRALALTPSVSADKKLGERPGSLLGCVNATRHPDGCGHSEACPDCELRRAALDALGGEGTACRLVRMRLRRDDDEIERDFVISAGPLSMTTEAPGALLVLNDVTGLRLP